MIGELDHQLVRKQAKPGDAALDRPAQRWRLHDRVAAGTSQFGTHMVNHAQAGRHELQLLGHVFTQWAQTAAAGRASLAWRCVNLLVTDARATASAPTFRAGLVGGRHLARRLDLVGLQVFQLQLQLLDMVAQLF